MNRHPTDEEILDLLAPGGAPTAELREHLAACPECRARMDAETPLSESLAELGPEIDPPRDLWPGVLERIESEPRRATPEPSRLEDRSRSAGWVGPALRAAAAVALFVAGAAVGRAFDGSDPGTVHPTAEGPLAAAAEVQRAGTAYVEAVARFRATAGDASGPVVDQARDVALAAVHGAAWELERLRPDDATAREIVALAGAGRGEASR